MPLQEFWYDDPDLLWAYRDAYIAKEKEKIELEKEMINYQAWLQGLYNFHAIAGVLGEKHKYLEQPIDLKPKTGKEKKLATAQKIKENMKKSQEILKQQRSENKD